MTLKTGDAVTLRLDKKNVAGEVVKINVPGPFSEAWFALCRITDTDHPKAGEVVPFPVARIGFTGVTG